MLYYMKVGKEKKKIRTMSFPRRLELNFSLTASNAGTAIRDLSSWDVNGWPAYPSGQQH